MSDGEDKGVMQLSVIRVVAVAGLVAAFWAVPSVGTRGQGTLGDRFAHVDRELIADSPAARASLRHADAVVTGAVAQL